MIIGLSRPPASTIIDFPSGSTIVNCWMPLGSTIVGWGGLGRMMPKRDRRVGMISRPFSTCGGYDGWGPRWSGWDDDDDKSCRETGEERLGRFWIECERNTGCNDFGDCDCRARGG